MTFEELRQGYMPRDQYTLLSFKSKETGRYVAVVYKKVEIKRHSKQSEMAETALLNITETDIDKYVEQVMPYLKKRQEDAETN